MQMKGNLGFFFVWLIVSLWVLFFWFFKQEFSSIRYVCFHFSPYECKEIETYFTTVSQT